MPVSIFPDGLSYIKALYELELNASHGPIMMTSSYLSSVYFLSNILERYYSSSTTDASGSAEYLIKRQKVVLSSLNHLPRKEIYEIDAFTRLISQGIVHEQEPNFRIRPFDIFKIIDKVLSALSTKPHLEIAITSEVLPMVYILVPPSNILIDIRTNYTYQNIQGQLITEENDAYIFFHKEFERLWQSPNTISIKENVIYLLNKSLQLWISGDKIDLSFWPIMHKTSRR